MIQEVPMNSGKEMFIFIILIKIDNYLYNNDILADERIVC